MIRGPNSITPTRFDRLPSGFVTACRAKPIVNNLYMASFRECPCVRAAEFYKTTVV